MKSLQSLFKKQGMSLLTTAVIALVSASAAQAHFDGSSHASHDVLYGIVAVVVLVVASVMFLRRTKASS